MEGKNEIKFPKKFIRIDQCEQESYFEKDSTIMITTLVFTEEIVTSLDAVMGRKHPNAVQAKQLRSSLPLIHVFLHLVTSQVYQHAKLFASNNSTKLLQTKFCKSLTSNGFKKELSNALIFL